MNEPLSHKSLPSLFEKANEKFGYKINKTGKLNIWIVRRDNYKVDRNTFDDVEVLFWYRDAGKGRISATFTQLACTSTPGTDNLLKPVNKKGTAILKPGQYPNAWTLGKHQGKYEALVQCGNFTVIRDNNKNDIPGDDPNYYEETATTFGINNHRASQWNILPWVGLYSAGCVVIQDPRLYQEIFMFNVKRFYNGGQKFFSPVIIDEKDVPASV